MRGAEVNGKRRELGRADMNWKPLDLLHGQDEEEEEEEMNRENRSIIQSKF